MARSPIQKENGYTPIAHAVLEGLALAPFATGHLKIIMHVIRRTYGWNRLTASIPNSEFVRATGMSKGGVSSALAQLIKQNVIVVLRPADSREPALYQLQKDPRLWGEFRCMPAMLAVLDVEGSPQQTQGSSQRTLTLSRVQPSEPQGSAQQTLEFTPLNPEGSADVAGQQEFDSERHLLKQAKNTSTDDAAANPPRAREGGSGGGDEIAFAIERMTATLVKYSLRIDKQSLRESFVQAAECVIDGTSSACWKDPLSSAGALVPWPDRDQYLRLALVKCLSEKRFGSSALETALRYCVPRERAPHATKALRADGSGTVADQVEAAQREAAAAAERRDRETREQREERDAARAIAAFESAHADEAAALLKRIKLEHAIQARKDPETWEPSVFIQAVITSTYRAQVLHRVRGAPVAAA